MLYLVHPIGLVNIIGEYTLFVVSYQYSISDGRNYLAIFHIWGLMKSRTVYITDLDKTKYEKKEHKIYDLNG